MRHGIFRKLIEANVVFCSALDRLCWPRMAVDGNESFVRNVKALVPNGATVADVGGGKTPLFSLQEVRQRGLSVIGIDIDSSELARAPDGVYSSTLVADITLYRGQPVANRVVVQSVLEHVRDNRGGAKGLSALCEPGGSVYTFCPNRRAWFALLNRLLPEATKRRLLFAIYPQKSERQGFPAFYDKCTPKELSKEFSDAGMDVQEVRPYFVSSYFKFFFPLYLIWRLTTLPLMILWPLAFCETFSIIAHKPNAS